MAGRLEGMVALITGGGSGIGRHIALLFNSHGANVAITGRRREALGEVQRAASAQTELLALPADVRKASDNETVVEEVERRWGRLDLLVTSAGVDCWDPVTEIDPEEWLQVVDTNLNGVFYTCRFALPLMVKSGGGSVIHVSSISGIVGTPGMSAYAASKGGIIALTREMALDYAPDGVRVNAICPGSIDTPMLRASFDRTGNPRRAEADAIARHPLGRLGTAQDVAYAALYLASSESSFVTGSSLIVDGGYTAQ